jgi:hypothetical protein
MNLILEAVQEQRIRIQYVHNSLMRADGLTRTLDSEVFNFFVKWHWERVKRQLVGVG